MFKFDESIIGRKVRFINTKVHEEMPEYYPNMVSCGRMHYKPSNKTKKVLDKLKKMWYN